MECKRVVILTRHHYPDNPIFASWSGGLSGPVDFVVDFDTQWTPPPDTALMITAQHYEEPEVTVLCKAMERGLPVLILADGILEFRNTWQNPSIIPGSIFQPVLGDKIAVLGKSQARILEAWGNIGKCEIVGAPRLDALLHVRKAPRDPHAPFRIVISTARTPGFTDDQRKRMVASLVDLKKWLDQTGSFIHGVPLHVVWRLTGNLSKEVGVPETVTETTRGIEAHSVLRTADALITTPSTLMLEGMLCHIPVALLDYTNRPPYVPAAWSITAKDHIKEIVPDLVASTPTRMLFQQTVLHDALQCESPAAPRMIALIHEMIRIFNQHKGRKPLFPHRIIPGGSDDVTKPEWSYDVKKLYADHPWFDTEAYQRQGVEYLHLRRYVAALERQIRPHQPPSNEKPSPLWRKIKSRFLMPPERE